MTPLLGSLLGETGVRRREGPEFCPVDNGIFLAVTLRFLDVPQKLYPRRGYKMIGESGNMRNYLKQKNETSRPE